MNQQFTQNLTQLSDFIIDSNEVGIVVGSHQNLDTVAAALALFLSLQNSGKNAQIVSLKEPTVEISSLVGVDKIKKSFTGNTTKLVVSLPYIKGEVEKVLFTEQPDTINFHLTAAPNRTITPFDLNKVKLNWEGGAPKNIITIGVGNQNELEGLIDIQASRIVNIDNYQNNSRFGEIVLVDESFSSLSEIVGKIIKDERLPFDQDSAQNILDGVLFATRNFTKGNTSPFAFEVASNAMYQGAQRRAETQMPQNQPRQQANQPQMDQGRPQFGQGNPRPYDVALFGDTQGKPFDSSQGRRQSQNQGPRNQFDQRQNNPRPNQGNQRRDNRQNTSFGGQNPLDYPQQGKQSQGSQNQFGQRQNPFDYAQGKQNRNQGQRVNPNDFPAMHIQDIRNQIQNDARMQNQRQDRGNNQQFSQDRQDNRAFNQPQPGLQEDRGFDPNIQNQPMSSIADGFDDQGVAPRPMPEPSYPQSSPFDTSMGKQDNQMPEEPQSVTDYNDEDVPDDWLMPKVFKSSKNNN